MPLPVAPATSASAASALDVAGPARPGDGSTIDGGDAAFLEALLARLAASSTAAELAAIGAADTESRTAHAFTAEIARALHLLLSGGTAADERGGVSTLRRVVRMADWLAERARTEPAVRGACDLAAGLAARLHAMLDARRSPSA